MLDPQPVCNKIKKKTKRMAKVLSPLPAADGEPLPRIITSQVSGLTTVELNVNMHSQTCADQPKKKILKMREGAYMAYNWKSNSDWDPEEKLVYYVYRHTKKQARIIPQPDPELEIPAVEEETNEKISEKDEKPPETEKEKDGEEKRKERWRRRGSGYRREKRR